MAAKKTKTTNKQAVSKKPAEVSKARVRKSPTYKSFRLQKRIPHPKGTPIGARRLLEQSFRLIWQVKKPLFGLLLVMAVLNLVFVRAFSAPFDVGEIRDAIEETVGGSVDTLSANLAIFSSVLGGDTQGVGPEAAGAYQSIFVLLFSLALVWLFRQHTAGNKVTARQALYRSTYPLVPTLLVLLAIGIQLLPFVIGSTLFSLVMEGGIATNGFEIALWWLVLLLLGLLSLYMVSSSVFALYIVTLPEMTPMKALRSARQLVLHRRFAIIRRLLVLPVVVFLIFAGLMLPAIFFVGVVAPWVYFSLLLLALPFLHAYVYSLYRDLL